MFKKAVLVVAALAGVTIAAPASAEWFTDLYVGGTFTQKNDVKTDSPDTGLTTTVTDVAFDSSVTGGVRAGYWFESLAFLGLGLDLSYFTPDVSKQTRTVNTCLSGLGCASSSIQFDDFDLHVAVIGFDLMLRYPFLKSEQFPKGQLQPYLTVGPALFIARGKDSTNFEPSHRSDTDVSLGVKVGGGVAWQFHKHFALFGEYRFTHFSPEFTLNDGTAGQTTLKTDVNTHHVLVGASYRF